MDKAYQPKGYLAGGGTFLLLAGFMGNISNKFSQPLSQPIWAALFVLVTIALAIISSVKVTKASKEIRFRTFAKWSGITAIVGLLLLLGNVFAGNISRI